jgi:hypothetical protein
LRYSLQGSYFLKKLVVNNKNGENFYPLDYLTAEKAGVIEYSRLLQQELFKRQFSGYAYRV